MREGEFSSNRYFFFQRVRVSGLRAFVAAAAALRKSVGIDDADVLLPLLAKGRRQTRTQKANEGKTSRQPLLL
jgi:hypothetical protein